MHFVLEMRFALEMHFALEMRFARERLCTLCAFAPVGRGFYSRRVGYAHSGWVHRRAGEAKLSFASIYLLCRQSKFDMRFALDMHTLRCVDMRFARDKARRACF